SVSINLTSLYLHDALPIYNVLLRIKMLDIKVSHAKSFAVHHDNLVIKSPLFLKRNDWQFAKLLDQQLAHKTQVVLDGLMQSNVDQVHECIPFVSLTPVILHLINLEHSLRLLFPLLHLALETFQTCLQLLLKHVSM